MDYQKPAVPDGRNISGRAVCPDCHWIYHGLWNFKADQFCPRRYLYGGGPDHGVCDDCNADLHGDSAYDHRDGAARIPGGTGGI